MNLNEWVATPFYSTLQILLVFLLPIITMRSFAEERQRGTMELLLSSPLSLGDIVWGKFLGAAGVLGTMLLIAGVFPLSLGLTTEVELMPLLVGFFGVILFGLAFLALGVAISALSGSQSVAAIVGMVVFLLFYLLDTAGMQMGGQFGAFLIRLAPAYRAGALMNGVIDAVDVLYFLSVAAFGIFVATRALEAQRASS